ncbi:mobilization protein MobC [Kitasatospora cineracea]|uniref:Mobilization protein MobC n=1 Tax=Kitasatospora cineracea TaxID=88074 RepID=A0A8G1XBA7_9ACTN|nr:mobilization protein MobC [Kitasatospora cineracea]
MPNPNDHHTTARALPEEGSKGGRLIGRLLLAFGNSAPGGASCTQSPTLRAGLGAPAPGVAEEARREGAPSWKVQAEGGPDPDKLNALQLDVLAPADQRAAPTLAADASVRATRDAFLHAKTAALDVPKLNVPKGAQPMPTRKSRKRAESRRERRVGPVSFAEGEYAELLDAAHRHGYGGTISGYLGDIALAFIRGDFTVDLPLHTDRLALQEFRAELLREVNAIGNNINQMVHVLHRDDRLEPDSRERLIRLEHLLLDIAEALLIPTVHHAVPEGGTAA